MANAEGRAGTVDETDAAAGEVMGATMDVEVDVGVHLKVDLKEDVSENATSGINAAPRVERSEPMDAIDPVIETLLGQLWEAANERGGKIWSLAKLSKRSQIPQSSLRRYLTSLTEAGLVSVTLDEAGLGSSTLTEFGRSVCMDLFGALGTAAL
jgi:IclR helix-turn-helix domain